MTKVVHLMCFRDVYGHQGCKAKQEYGEFQNQHFVITGKVFLLLFWAIELSFLVHGEAPCGKSMTKVK
jgi:hypothetical protein